MMCDICANDIPWGGFMCPLKCPTCGVKYKFEEGMTLVLEPWMVLAISKAQHEKAYKKRIAAAAKRRTRNHQRRVT